MKQDLCIAWYRVIPLGTAILFMMWGFTATDAASKGASRVSSGVGRCLSFYNATEKPITLVLDVYTTAVRSRVSSWFARKLQGKEEGTEQRILQIEPYEIASIKQMPRASLRGRFGGKVEYVKNISLDATARQELTEKNKGKEEPDYSELSNRLVSLDSQQVQTINSFFNSLSDRAACTDTKAAPGVPQSQLVHIINAKILNSLDPLSSEPHKVVPFGKTDIYLYPFVSSGSVSIDEKRLQSGGRAQYQLRKDESNNKPKLKKKKRLKPRDVSQELLFAVEKGSVNEIKQLLEEGADIHIKDKNGRTPLIRAVKAGNKEVVRELLKGGADPNDWGHDGLSAIDIAAKQANGNAILFLLQGKSEHDVRPEEDDGDEEDFEELIGAAERGDQKLVSSLVVHIMNTKNVSEPLTKEQKTGVSQKALNLIELGVRSARKAAEEQQQAEVSVQAKVPETSETPTVPKASYEDLMQAINAGNSAAVQAYISQGIDVNESDTKQSPLMAAIIAEKRDIVKALLDAKADVNRAERDGTLPLFEAVRKGDSESVRLLLAAGAKIGLDRLQRPLLVVAARAGHDDIVSQLLNAGAEVDAIDPDKKTALMRAAQEGHEPIVKALLVGGADVALADKFGKTALEFALAGGHIAVAEALVSQGADIGTKDLQGQTLLEQFVLANNEAAVQFLLDKGADVNEANAANFTPIMLAAQKNHPDIMKLLIKKGAKRPTDEQEQLLRQSDGNDFAVIRMSHIYDDLEDELEPEPVEVEVQGESKASSWWW